MRLLAALLLLASPAFAQTTVSPLTIGGVVDMSAYATKAEVSSVTAGLATTGQLSAVQAAIPTAGTGSPTAIVDTNSGTPGSAGVYAPFNHTHPSKARKGIVTTATDGTVTATFGAAFPAGTVPVCQVVAAPAAGTTDVINAQLDGAPTATGVAIRVTRTQRSVVSLIGLTVLSVPASVGATSVHYVCLEP